MSNAPHPASTSVTAAGLLLGLVLASPGIAAALPPFVDWTLNLTLNNETRQWYELSGFWRFQPAVPKPTGQAGSEVAAAPASPYDPVEAEDVRRYVEAGGTLIVLPPSSPSRPWISIRTSTMYGDKSHVGPGPCAPALRGQG